MTKIMLVEDDKSLREIYGVRLLAEGYDIVSAGDGEEALAMAIKERPGLIISDVMMPKVSGYDMLDILRSTTETKDIKVIMMTALSSDEQRNRAESLGADRYLVKSQVGIEDVVRVVHEVLADTPGAATTTPAPSNPPATTPTPTLQQPVQSAPAAPTPTPHLPPSPIQNTPAPAPTPTVPTPLPIPGAGNTPQPMMPKPAAPPKPASLKSRVIQPLNDPSLAPLDINELLDKELSKEAGLSEEERPVVASVDQAKAQMEAQLQSFAPPEPTPVAPPEAITDPVPVPPSGPSILPTPGVVTNPQAILAPTPQPSVQNAPAAPTPHLPPSPIQNAPAPAPIDPATPSLDSSDDGSMSMPTNIPTVEVPEVPAGSVAPVNENHPASTTTAPANNPDVPIIPAPHPSTPTQLPQVTPPSMPQPTHPVPPTSPSSLPSPTSPVPAQTRTLESPNAFTTNVPQTPQSAAPQLPEVPKV